MGRHANLKTLLVQGKHKSPHAYRLMETDSHKSSFLDHSPIAASNCCFVQSYIGLTSLAFPSMLNVFLFVLCYIPIFLLVSMLATAFAQGLK